MSRPLCGLASAALLGACGAVGTPPTAPTAPGFAARPTEILWATDTELKVWPGFEPDLAERLNEAIDELLRDVEGLADDPRVTQVDTGHAIQEERPGVVIAAIRRVLGEVRR